MYGDPSPLTFRACGFLEERLTESNIGIQIANFGPNVVRPRSCSTVFLIIPTLLLRQ